MKFLHIDLFGPVSIASIIEKKYGLVTVDYYSIWTWVIKFLKNKDESYDVFNNFCTQVQNDKEVKILNVRSDHGGELKMSHLIYFFVKNMELSHEFSSLRTPQQNEVVERRNRSLQEMTCTMIYETDMANYFWGEVINTSCYVQNRIFMKPILNKIAYELFQGRRPNISYFCQYGYTCFILNNKVYVKKFDVKAEK